MNIQAYPPLNSGQEAVFYDRISKGMSGSSNNGETNRPAKIEWKT